MKLSRERAEAVSDYLVKNFKLDAGRVASHVVRRRQPRLPATSPIGAFVDLLLPRLIEQALIGILIA